MGHTLSRYTCHPTNSQAGPAQDDDLSYAKRLQSEFDNEVFECGICMEEMPEDFVARTDPCGHAFCRECVRGYVSTRLEERRFPVLCPTCTAGKGKGKGITGST